METTCTRTFTSEYRKAKDYKPEKIIGKVLMVNNYNFNKRDCNRSQGIKHWEQLKEKFENLGFKIVDDEIKYNLSKEKLLQCVKLECCKKDLKDISSFFICISSYGYQGVVICPGSSVDELCEISDIQKLMYPQTCENLIFKPKIFILQADDDYKTSDRPQGPADDKKKYEKMKIPTHIDFLTITSTEPAHHSHEGETTSHFVKAICDSLEDWRHKKIHFLQCSIRMNQNLSSIDFFTLPQTTSTLTKFFKYQEEGNKLMSSNDL